MQVGYASTDAVFQQRRQTVVQYFQNRSDPQNAHVALSPKPFRLCINGLLGAGNDMVTKAKQQQCAYDNDEDTNDDNGSGGAKVIPSIMVIKMAMLLLLIMMMVVMRTTATGSTTTATTTTTMLTMMIIHHNPANGETGNCSGY